MSQTPHAGYPGIMSNDPQEPRKRATDADEGTVSEPSADPTPPATEATTSEDVHDTPQSPTRPDVAEQDGSPD